MLKEIFMHSFFIPDAMYQNIYKLTPAFLSQKNKRNLIFDIDNTVAPYEIETPTDKMKQYFDLLVQSGIRVAFVSNNSSGRAELFNIELGFFCVSDAGKPSPDGIHKCLEHFGADPKETVLVGDQIFTDCLAAHRAGIECYLVKPIKDKKTLFFRLKRFFERPMIAEYKKRKREQKAMRREERQNRKKEKRGH